MDIPNTSQSVPDTWNVRPLGEITITQIKSSIKVRDAQGIGYFPFFTSGNKILRSDTYIVDNENIFMATGGEANIKYYRGKASYSTDTFVFNSKYFNLEYIYYYLLNNIQNINYSFFSGSGLKHLQKGDLKKFHIRIPKSVFEQLKIAEILTTCDDSIEKTDAIIEKLKRIKLGIIKNLFRFGLNESGQIQSEATCKIKDSFLGKIPISWEIVKLSSLAKIIDPQPDHRAPKEEKDGYPYIGIGDFRDNIIEFEKCRRISKNDLQRQLNSFTVERGDILFGKIGTIGDPKLLTVLIEPYALNANTILIKPNESNSFVYWLLQSDYIKGHIANEINKTSQPAFGIIKVRDINVPVPISPVERYEISKILDSFERIIRYEFFYKNKLISIKNGLMKDLISGNVRVNHLLNRKE